MLAPYQVRNQAMTMADLTLGVNIASIGSDPVWWRSAVPRPEAAGYQGIWIWDHFMGPKGAPIPVVEAWTALSVSAGITGRVELSSFVLNVMDRHPAVVAGMAATLHQMSGGRLVLGIGIGGGLEEHAAIGIPLPPAPERVVRLREAVAVIRALWTGELVTDRRRTTRSRRRPATSWTAHRRSSWAGRPAPAPAKGHLPSPDGPAVSHARRRSPASPRLTRRSESPGAAGRWAPGGPGRAACPRPARPGAR